MVPEKRLRIPVPNGVRVMVPRFLFVFISVAMLLHSGCALTSGKKKSISESEREESLTAVAEDSERPEKIQYTFLDTINKGNELLLTDEDFDNSNQQQVSRAVSDVSGNETRYRVQVFASNRIETIREQKKLLEKKISEPVAIGYEAPYYKLFAGNFSKRLDATGILPKLKKLGYPDAWVVSTSSLQQD